jgi:hypothetical protein
MLTAVALEAIVVNSFIEVEADQGVEVICAARPALNEAMMPAPEDQAVTKIVVTVLTVTPVTDISVAEVLPNVVPVDRAKDDDRFLTPIAEG